MLATSHNALELTQEDFVLLDSLALLGAEAKRIDWRDPDFPWQTADLIVLRSTWDYHLHLKEFLAWLDRVSINSEVINTPSLIRWNADKRYLLELESRNIPIVPTALCQLGVRVSEIVESRRWSSIVIKPAVAAGAYETLVFDLPESEAAAQSHLDRLAMMGSVLVQPYLDAITVEGETSLVYFEGDYYHAVRKTPGPGEFRVQSEFGGRYDVVDPRPDQLELADRILVNLPEIPVYARVDLVDIGGTPHLMELEIIEPELFFSIVPQGAVVFADILRERFREIVAT